MVVYSIACPGRGLKHRSACTGILMPYWGTVTVQKSLGSRAGLGRAWDEKKTLLSSTFSSSSCQFAFQELSSNPDTVTERLPCCPWWGAVVGLACAFGAARVAGRGGQHLLPSPPPKGALRQRPLGILGLTDGWMKKAKSSQTALAALAAWSCATLMLPHAVLGTEDTLHPQEPSPYAHWLHTAAPGAIPERTMM